MHAPLLCEPRVLRSVFRELPADHDDPRFDTYLRARFERMSRESRIIFGFHHGMFPYAPAPVASGRIARHVGRTHISRETITAIHNRLTHKLALDWPYFKEHGDLPAFVVERPRTAAPQSVLNQRLLRDAFAQPELAAFDDIAPLLRPHLPTILFNTVLRVVDHSHLRASTLRDVQDLLRQDDVPLRQVGVKRQTELRRLLVDGEVLQAVEARGAGEQDEETMRGWWKRVLHVLAPLAHNSEDEMEAMIANDPELRAKIDESVRNQRRQLLDAILAFSERAGDTTSPTLQRVQAMRDSVYSEPVASWEQRWVPVPQQPEQDGQKHILPELEASFGSKDDGGV